jgi:MFS family permease
MSAFAFTNSIPHLNQTTHKMAPEDSQTFERKSHFKSYTVFLIIFMGFGSAAYGYAASIIATTLTQPSFFEAMNLATASNADALIGATNGLFYTGGIFGSFCCGWMSMTYGRKISATFGALLILISSALLTVAVNMGMFITFRFFTGWGCFQLLATVPLWIAEIAPPKIRGILVDIHPVMVNFGYTCASYVGIGFYYYTGGGKNTWRGPMGLSMVFPTIFLSGVYWLPESPRFLLSKDRIEEAWAIIHRLHSDTSDPTDEFAKREFYQMRKQIELDLSMSSPTITASYIQILRKASTRKRAFITMFLTFAQMSSGAIVINSMSTSSDIFPQQHLICPRLRRAHLHPIRLQHSLCPPIPRRIPINSVGHEHGSHAIRRPRPTPLPPRNRLLHQHANRDRHMCPAEEFPAHDQPRQARGLRCHALPQYNLLLSVPGRTRILVRRRDLAEPFPRSRRRPRDGHARPDLHRLAAIRTDGVCNDRVEILSLLARLPPSRCCYSIRTRSTSPWKRWPRSLETKTWLRSTRRIWTTTPKCPSTFSTPRSLERKTRIYTLATMRWSVRCRGTSCSLRNGME